jgi:hypothetical protein
MTGRAVSCGCLLHWRCTRNVAGYADLAVDKESDEAFRELNSMVMQLGTAHLISFLTWDYAVAGVA